MNNKDFRNFNKNIIAQNLKNVNLYSCVVYPREHAKLKSACFRMKRFTQITAVSLGFFS